MNNFELYNPVKVIVGKNIIKKVSDYIPKESKLAILYGCKSIKDNGIYDLLSDTLKNFEKYEYSGITPNPCFEQLDHIANNMQKDDIDFILAVGGGSVIDSAKFISATINSNNRWNYSKSLKYKKEIDLGVILTMPATGSEMNGSFVITNEAENDKMLFLVPKIFPTFSILDITTIESIPKKHIRNGIIDAYIHVLEQYLTVDNGSELQYQFSEAILRTLKLVGFDLINNNFTEDNCRNFMLCTTYALNGTIQSGVIQDWSSHMIGHELTLKYGIDHAESIAITMPAVLRFCKSYKEKMLLRFGKNILDLNKDELAVDTIIDKIEEFFVSLGMNTKLSSYIKANHSEFRDIAENMAKLDLLPLGERQDINKEEIEEILSKAY